MRNPSLASVLRPAAWPRAVLRVFAPSFSRHPGPGLRTLVGVLALLWLPPSVQAQWLQYTIAPESRLWIDGSATTGSFTCETPVIEGAGRVVAGRPPEVVLAVPTQSLDCGHRRMNADLYAALDADAHPHIQFTLVRVDSVALDPEAAWQHLHLTGLLALAGVTREVSVPLQWRQRTDGALQGYGAFAVLMTDFGIQPPRALLGLVRARNQITVRFNLMGIRASSAP